MFLTRNMSSPNYLPCVVSWLLIFCLGINIAMSEEYRTYIIHMDHTHKPESFLTHESWHRSTLRSLSSPVLDDQKFLYSYSHVLHGFSARLTLDQVAEIKNLPAHLATYEESFGKLLTTHSPKFLGLNHVSGLWPNSSYGEGAIIGVIDSGTWPESASFHDHGMPPVPQRWKGTCQNGTIGAPFACNKKLIGAQTFTKGIETALDTDVNDDSPRDQLGHGTHTSSTAAGNFVDGASQFGFASGTARGVAPRAHVAMYKVTNTHSIVESDVLAAMDQAVADGVDVLSLSLGFTLSPYFQDVVAIASLSAIEKGIVVVCAAGNNGSHNTTNNGAPWITTIGAGTTDRSFTSSMTLGNGLTIEGSSSFAQSIYISDTSLYYGGDSLNKSVCGFNTMNTTEIAGKVVVCGNSSEVDIHRQLDELSRVGAYAAVIISDDSLSLPSDQEIPFLVLPTSSGALVKGYAMNANNPNVISMRFYLTRFGTRPSPQVADFSSRGPDPILPSLLKPDVIAPGVDILAAIPSVPVPFYSFSTSNYTLVSDYALSSGTSMATPHVAGVAALLKAAHPEWSPAAIRSALMTTAYVVDNSKRILTDQLTNLPATPLDFGAGHINPNRAMDPGLIYDLEFQDYIDFICSLGYNTTEMKTLLRRDQWNCSQDKTDLNYPSFVSIFSNGSTATKQVFNRVLTNVGDDQSIYQSRVALPYGMNITVEPSTLTFTQKYQKQNFSVTVEVYGQVPPVVYGYLTWFDEHKHTVSSPVVALTF